MSYLKNAYKYLPFRILALFTSTTSSVPPVCSICSCPSIISSQPGGGGAAYHLLALSAVLLLLLLVLLLRLVQLLWSPHLFELSALIHLHGYYLSISKIIINLKLEPSFNQGGFFVVNCLCLHFHFATNSTFLVLRHFSDTKRIIRCFPSMFRARRHLIE